MRHAVCICVYNETALLRACLKQIPDWVDEIVVLVSQDPWRGNSSPSAYKTHDVLRTCKDKRLKWLVNSWKNEEDQRNFGLGMLYGYDWVITIDADEYFTKEGWQELKTAMETYGTCNLIVANMKTYWKTPDFRWEPPDIHKPTIALRPNRVSFHDKREVTSQMHRILRSPMHHFSWVRTDEEVLQKVQNYMHASDFDGKTWYATVWKGWHKDMINIRPYGEKNTKAILDPAPKEIVDLFD